MTIARIGPEFLVNATTTSIQREPTIAALPDGRYIVTWRDYSQSGGDLSNYAIRARIFNADGSQSVPEFVVNTTTSGGQVDSNIAVLPDGRFVVSWTDDSASGGDTSGAAIRARIFNADGTQSVAEFLVNTTVLNGQDGSSITALPDGRFIVSWSDASASGGDTSDAAIRARIFNANGSELVAEFIVNTTTTGTQNSSSITALPDGRFIVCWTDASASGGDTSNTAIRARIFNANGSESVPEFLVNTTTLNSQVECTIAALPDGRFIVTWSDFSMTGGDASSYAIRARIFNDDGTESVPEFLVNSTTLGLQFESNVAVLTDGRFIVVWTDSSSSGGDTSLYATHARIFNTDGTQSVPEFLVNTTTSGDQFESSVAVLADGRIVISWTDGSVSGGDLSSYAVRSQIFDPTIFDGTTAADIATGGSFDDRYNGYAGDDTLSGLGGDDRLNGGDGEDTLNGDDGGDTLDGGAGGDNLYGGAGNDFIYGRSGNELMSGGTGGDHFWGGVGADQHIGGDDAGVDYARYDDANWGNLVIRLDNAALNTGIAAGDTYTGIEGIIGGAGLDTIYGNGSDNHLFGGGAADHIYGKTGNDYLSGDAGSDDLWGGAGDDTLDGGNGVDRLIGGDGNDTYITDAGDRITETANGGIDLVKSSVSRNLGGNLENLTLTGTAAINGIGNALDNVLRGNAAANVLNGATGADTLFGGVGSDIFVFNSALGPGNIDRISDFNAAADTIRLDDAIFTGLASGVLSADALATNASGLATTPLDRIIYETDTGRLYFDSDGVGGAARIQFAVLSSGLTLTNADFFVF